ncbi:hypothetical protein R1flu_015971 [Riccia fluitans]|uniref:Uncharacterized protein n=1 Tax=Riccia fluitans TaxID=41844 RepID=A0ABD1YLA7_9MARC
MGSPPFISPAEPSVPEDERQFQIPRAPPSNDHYSTRPFCLSGQISGIGVMLTQFERYTDQMRIELDSPWAYNEFFQRLIRMQGEYEDLAEQLVIHWMKIEALEEEQASAELLARD